MFGAERRIRAPVVLVLVFGVLLVLVGITATAQAIMVSAYASSSTLSSIVASDVSTIRGFAHQGLDGLDVQSPDAASLELVDGYLATLLAKGEIAHAEIRDTAGRVVASSAPGMRGATRPMTADFAAAISGTPSVATVDATDAEADGVPLPNTVLREYLPLQQKGQTLLVIATWRDAAPILSGLETLRRDVVLVTLTAALVAAGVLYLVFRSTQGRISRQTAALVEAGRRDPLTDSLNHGALVAHLATQIEIARSAGSSLGVALVDIDNFRLFNENHGHRAGDELLLAVAEALRTSLSPGIVMGRYGPDEFLLVAGSLDVADLRPVVDDFRTRLAELGLRFDSTEELPVTVSVGLCVFPDHGASVTGLLSTAAATLQEAQVGGGDAVRVAGSEPEGEQTVATFDVLQGLVFAVDTKDRYTKRHSEDVARYSVFIAERLGLGAGMIEVIHTSALLHDVGKIGVPDAILRKPGRLTADEFDIVKQHVALGDMVVRELPGIEDIRAGIRYHHERWDGRGYLEALAGDEIPLVARILAIGDAFSAMTTTRPYRKAVDTREALARLGDAAGTQLDEALVTVFIAGIETDPDAPLPSWEGTRASLWTPRRSVA